MDRVTLKLKYEGIVRRVPLKKVSMEEVNNIVFSMYKIDNYKLSYTDDEGDKILVECDSELQEALAVSIQSTKVPLIRLDVTKIEKKEEKKEEKEEDYIKCLEEESRKTPEIEDLEKKMESMAIGGMCHVCKLREVRLACLTCEDYALCENCHFENIVFRSHHNPTHVFRSHFTANVNPNVVVERVVTIEPLKEEEEKKEEVKEEEKKEEVKEMTEEVKEKEEESLMINPVGALLRLFLGEREEAKEEEVKEEEVEVVEEVPEARRKALEALSPMGFEEKRMNEVLDFVDNNVEAALEILVGDAC
uniref:ZZ-type domain-containing protein n=1 Tax=Paramoeba aestuarina TaxID=180227 RepID=A0A7S4N9K1_9EUKA|mmetsp:Transcript_12773/g.19616  ORF Transcript_12773/g.19616 Transcript_12773/m.19616 type:complete len:305 (+) Transcript_12773:132-1046(+)